MASILGLLESVLWTCAYIKLVCQADFLSSVRKINLSSFICVLTDFKQSFKIILDKVKHTTLSLWMLEMQNKSVQSSKYLFECH